MANDLAVIQNMIYEVRGHRVMLDSDLAALYEVETKMLNRAVKRNIARFPSDFMFQLTKDELNEVVPNWNHLEKFKYRSTLPYVFTEQGVAMLAAVLNSQKAIDVNIYIMRAFVALKNYALTQNTTDKRIEELRKLLMLHIENTDNRLSEHDSTINQIIEALNNLIEQPREPKRLGFHTGNE
jgi:phage regulator Rha-like protein